MSDLEVKKDWMDYTNLAANIHQSIKLGEISNQLSQLTSINTAMLGNMNNLVNVEVYKLEQKENEKQFKQLLFNLKKFVKTKYDDPLTVALLKNGHCKMIDSLLDNFQRELSSFEDKEYVEKIMDSFNEYSSVDVDFDALAKENEDGVTLLLSYMMFANNISATVKELKTTSLDVKKVRSEHISPMQVWSWESLNEYMKMIGSPHRYASKPKAEYSMLSLSKIFEMYIDKGEKWQFILKNKKPFNWSTERELNDAGVLTRFFIGVKKYKKEVERIENEVLPPLIGGSEKKADTLSIEVKKSMGSLSEDIKKSNAEWINVEKKLLNIMYDTTLPIQGPYQYRKQVIGE